MSDPESPVRFESRDLATLIVDALVDAGLLPSDKEKQALDIATEEIDVRIALGNVEIK